MEIISDPEWDEFETIVAKKKDDNPNPRKGLFGLMVASFLRSRNYFLKVEPNEEGNKERHQIAKEYIPDTLKQFNEHYKAFEDRMRPLVYELGFLYE